MSLVNTSSGNGTGGLPGDGSGGCSLINNIYVYCGGNGTNVTTDGNSTGNGTGNGTGPGPVVDNCKSTNVLLDQEYYEFW